MLKDFIGRELHVGDVIAFVANSTGKMIMAKIDSFTRHQCVCTPLFGQSHDYYFKTITCYAQQCVRLDQNDVTMYLLTRTSEEQK